MSDDADAKYRQELDQAAGSIDALINDCFQGVTPKKSTIVLAYKGLEKLVSMSSESTRWASRMLLLERRIRAAQKIFDGETEVSVDSVASESKFFPVLLRRDEAAALLQETSGKTGSLSERAKRARDDIAEAIAEHPVTAAREEEGS